MTNPLPTPPSHPLPATLCMTFDDRFIGGWHSARDIFKRYDVRATFFLCWPERMTNREWRMLGQLRDDGHEIGCHTMTHTRLPKFLLDKTLGDYLTQEIDPWIDFMRTKGFEATSFSYPYYKYHPDLHQHLLERFKILRVSGPIPDYAAHLVPKGGANIVHTFCSSDMTGQELPLRHFSDRFDMLKRHGGIGITCGHAVGSKIPKNPTMRCSLDDLETIVAFAAAYGFDFRTLTEIAPAESAAPPLSNTKEWAA